MPSRAVALCIALLVLTASGLARGQGNPRAESLFQEARELVDSGRYAEACPKLEESQRLEPAVGTQFNLADCHEHVGRTATAYALFNQVAAIARAAGKFDRERSARARAEALEPKLARVRIVVAGDAPGLEVKIDGAPIARDSWTTALPIDPGAHQVTATAPGRRPFERSVEAEERSLEEISVPELEELEPRKEAAPALAPPAAPEGASDPPPSRSRTLAYVAGGVGVAALATGTIAAVLSLSSRADAQSACPKEVYAFRCPTESGTDAWNAATTAGNVATVGFVVTGVALAAAVVLWVTAPAAPPRGRSSASTLLLEGRF